MHLALKVTIVCFLVLLPQVISAQSVIRQKMIVGYNDVPPDSTQINGEVAGAANQLLRDVAAAMNVDLQFENMPLARLREAIKTDGIDCISNIGGKAVVEGGIFADTPLIRTIPGLAVRIDSSWKEPVGADQLGNVMIGTKLKMALTATMARIPPSRIKEASGELALTHNLRMLVRNRVDAVYSPRIAELVYFAHKEGLSDQVRFIKLDDEPWEVFTLFSGKGARAFKEDFDKQLKLVLQKKSYESYLQDFFKQQKDGGAVAQKISPFLKP